LASRKQRKGAVVKITFPPFALATANGGGGDGAWVRLSCVSTAQYSRRKCRRRCCRERLKRGSCRASQEETLHHHPSSPSAFLLLRLALSLVISLQGFDFLCTSFVPLSPLSFFPLLPIFPCCCSLLPQACTRRNNINRTSNRGGVDYSSTL
jgi:hypothetical protein